MRLANSETRYGTVAKVLHWLTALMIIALIPLGLIADALSWDTPEALALKARAFSVHKTLGVALFFIAIARILWTLTQPRPGPIHPDRKAEVFLASSVHWALYGALVIVPLSGWVHHAATTGFAPILWPLGQGLPMVPKSDAVAEAASGVHWLAGRVLMVALALHVAGTLKHHVFDRDAVLGRMWFGRTEAGSAAPKNRRPFIAALVVWIAVLVVGIGSAPRVEISPTPALAPIATGWTVNDGTLEIRISQFGQEVTGVFQDWTASIDFDPALDAGSVKVVVSIPSLTLGSVTKEAMAPAYLDAESHPEARFAGTVAPDREGYMARGTLTLKGREIQVNLPFTLDLTNGTAVVTGSVDLDRRDFGIGDPADTTLGTNVTVNVTLTALHP